MSEIVETLYGELSDGAFFAPASSDLVDSLIGQYKQLRAEIEMMSGLIDNEFDGTGVSVVMLKADRK